MNKLKRNGLNWSLSIAFSSFIIVIPAWYLLQKYINVNTFSLYSFIVIPLVALFNCIGVILAIIAYNTSGRLKAIICIGLNLIFPLLVIGILLANISDIFNVLV